MSFLLIIIITVAFLIKSVQFYYKYAVYAREINRKKEEKVLVKWEKVYYNNKDNEN